MNYNDLIHLLFLSSMNVCALYAVRTISDSKLQDKRQTTFDTALTLWLILPITTTAVHLTGRPIRQCGTYFDQLWVSCWYCIQTSEPELNTTSASTNSYLQNKEGGNSWLKIGLEQPGAKNTSMVNGNILDFELIDLWTAMYKKVTHAINWIICA